MSRSKLNAPNGEPTGAVFGFANIIGTILEKESPDYVCIVFDTAEPTFRHKMYDEYKANRPEFPEELVPQLKRIKQFIKHLGISQIERPGFEADDIIGTMTKWAVEHDIDVFCVTSDKDYMQLVNDRVKIYRPTSGSSGEYSIIDIEGVKEKFGVTPDQVIDVLAIMGDSVDNVPGVKGVGEKTAIPLVQQFGSVENIYERLDEIPRQAVVKKFVEHREMAFLSKELVTIHMDVPMEIDLKACQPGDKDLDGLRDLFLTLNFRRVIPQRFGIDLDGDGSQTEGEAASAAGGTAGYKTLATSEHRYEFVNTISGIRKLVTELKDCTLLAFDTETTGVDPMRCDIVGMSLSAEEGRAWYIPLFAPHRDFSDWQELADDVQMKEDAQVQDSLFSGDASQVPHAPEQARALLALFKPLLENASIGKVGQNAKYDMLVLKRYGIEVGPIGFDTMLASYVLDSGQKHNMDTLARTWLNYDPVSITTLIGEKKKEQKTMDQLPPEQITDYAGEDADITLRLCGALQPALEKEDLLDLARTTEFELIAPLATMEFNGIGLDQGMLAELSEYIGKETVSMRAKIFEETGVEFNLDSPRQLGDVLFEKMQIPPVKKTKTGYSTDASVLDELARSYPVAQYIIEYRQLTKLKSTYVDALPRMVNPRTGRIHTNYNQTIASTGRLSSTDPNLQNIPIRTDLGRQIRRAFVPQAAGATIFSADYSQIELRIMAHFSGDPTLIDAFKHGHDIHSATAAKLFGVALDQVDAEMRRRAKTVNFGLMYGLGAFGLAQRLGISRSEGKAIIEAYFASYPGIKDYIDRAIEDARANGYGATMLGRRRHFPEINSGNRVMRTAAERAAINMPIQGSAADMLKLAMVRIHRDMRERKLQSLMMLQVHDELVFEMLPEESEILPQLVREHMENALPLGEVPVTVSMGSGDNWAEAH